MLTVAGKDNRDQLLHLVRLRQLEELHGILVHLLHPARHQRKTNASLHQAQHRENVIHPGNNLRFEPGDMKRFLKPCIRGEPFCKSDKFLVFVITQIRGPAGIQRGGSRCSKEDVVME